MMSRSLWVRDAWPFFVENDPSACLQTIVRAIAAHAIDCAVIALAQASMAPAALALTGLGVAVLSSPELGVE